MLRLLFRVLLLVCLVGPVVFVWAALERDSTLSASATLDPKMAVQARGLVARLRTAMREPAPEGATVGVYATQTELDSAIATAARMVRPLRGSTSIGPEEMTIAISGQVPGLPDLGWINLSAEVAPSNTGLDVRHLQLGRMSLPPAMTVAVLRGVLDLATSGDLGSLLLNSVSGVQMEPGRVEVVLRVGTADGAPVFDKLTAGLRGLAGMGDMDQTAAHFAAMAEAARTGVLPDKGSSLPWIRFALAQVAEAEHSSRSDQRADLRASLLALAAHCGDRSVIETMTGKLSEVTGDSACSGTTLDGRVDLRKHFTLSAALAVASGSAMSFGVGEVKELLDAGKKKGSGFSFDDIAMDRAGIRFAETSMATPPDELPALIALMKSESDIVPAVDDLPSLMSEATFLTRFGGVDTPAYDAQIAQIDARIDALPFNQP